MKKSKKMILIFMGPPGSGKGTQTDVLAEALGIPAISTGELLRSEMKRKTKIGLLIAGRMDQGKMVDDEIVNEVMVKRLKHSDVKNGFILDGFPRHFEQIKHLNQMLAKFGSDDVTVALFFIKITATEVRKRLGHRRVCYNCGRTYHLEINPPAKKGVCDACEHALERRPDDQPEAITRRLKIFHRDNDPLLDYFSEHAKVFVIDGKQSIKKVQSDILKDIKKI